MILQKKTAVIIGSGIAGLSLAEILSRNNYKVIILESQSKIGGEASLATQKWYHTGWLYAALPNTAAMLGCYNALHMYHKIYENVFSENEINIDLHNGVDYPDRKEGWFINDRIYYLYAVSSYELTLAQRFYWPIYLNSVVFKRLRKNNYKIDKISKIDDNLKILFDSWEGNINGYKKYLVVRSTDAKIETEKVTKSLISQLNKDTEIYTNASFKLSVNHNKTELFIDTVKIQPDILVIASGKSMPGHLNAIGCDKIASQIKSIKSPITILNEVLQLPDFIRYTPNVVHTINHIKLKVNGSKKVSTIGSYYSFPLEENPDINYYEDLMRSRIGISKEKVLGSYYGIKTEFVGNKDRKYNHAIMKVNDNTFFALAGKLSQFPLLVHDFINQSGLSLESNPDKEKIIFDPSIIASTYPEEIVNKKSFIHKI
jgi:uncharacterized protein with NAD-binding domain and iron-sulfur cluster